jgi:hypothetical protein
VSTKATLSLLGVGLAAIAGAFVLLFDAQDSTQQDKLRLEVGKGLIQLAVIGVLGTILKLVADGHQRRSERADSERDSSRETADRNHEFRADKRKRLVTVTNALRKAPIVIQAERSVESWTEQMLKVIDAGFELRAVKHEVDGSRTGTDPPFSKPSVRIVLGLLESMQEYIDEFAGDYKHKGRLDSLERSANAKRISAKQRMQREDDLWTAISSLDGFSDMMTYSEDRKSARLTRRYSKYELNYEKVIDVITTEGDSETA